MKSISKMDKEELLCWLASNPDQWLWFEQALISRLAENGEGSILQKALLCPIERLREIADESMESYHNDQ